MAKVTPQSTFTGINSVHAGCFVTKESPFDIIFPDYLTTYTCNDTDDCGPVRNQYKQAVECITRESPNFDIDGKPLGISTKKVCEVVVDSQYPVLPDDSDLPCRNDLDCDETEFCSVFGGPPSCKNRGMVVKARSINADNLVIPAGETRPVQFYIDSEYGTVSERGKMHIVTHTNPQLRYEVKEAPSFDVVGSKRTFDECSAPQNECGTNYYRTTVNAYLQGDDIYTGFWQYDVENTGTEDITILAAFFDFDTRWD